jgi:hypothetical protein
MGLVERAVPERLDSRRVSFTLPTDSPMPDPKVEIAIELAKRVGTYRKDDRSKQYEGRYSSEALLGSINALGYNQRKRDKAQFRRHVIVMVLGAILARAPEIAAWLYRIFQ